MKATKVMFSDSQVLEKTKSILYPNEATKMSQNSVLYSPLENKNELETDYEVVEEKLIENTNNVNSAILSF